MDTSLAEPLEVYNFDAFGTHTDVFLLKAGQSIRQHRHDYRHLIFIGSGTVSVAIGSLCKNLSKGDQITAPNGAYHQITALTDATVINTMPIQE